MNSTAISHCHRAKANNAQDSLVLRSRPASRAVSPLKDDLARNPPPPAQTSPRLLPAAPEHETDNTGFQAYMSRHGLRTAEMVVLGLKLLSLYIPCLPSAMRPIIVAPLMILALADFLSPQKSFWLSMALVLVHASVLGAVLLRQELCLHPEMLWHDEYEHAEL